MQRFYKSVTCEACEGGFEILLDGRRLKTPGKQALIVPDQALARLIAAEWDAQIETIRPEIMPVTRLINVAIERTPANRQTLIDEARKYGETDVLCYRAIDPPRLIAKQAEHWDPILDWASHRGLSMRCAQGVIAIEQDESTLEAIAKYAASKDNIELTLFVHFIAVFGSAILAIATLERHLSAEQALALSRLDEQFQIEQWGEDEDAKIRTRNIEDETLALGRVISTL